MNTFCAGDTVVKNTTGKLYTIDEVNPTDKTYTLKNSHGMTKIFEQQEVEELFSRFNKNTYSIESKGHICQMKSYVGITEVYKWCDCGKKEYGTT